MIMIPKGLYVAGLKEEIRVKEQNIQDLKKQVHQLELDNALLKGKAEAYHDTICAALIPLHR
jgi:FtsZ-binding cell division protein ZapB